MPWSVRTSITPAALASLVLILGCGDDGNGQSSEDTAVHDSGTTASSGTTAASTSASTSDNTSASGSETASTSAADSTTGLGEPFACGGDRLTCNPGEVCVAPCCGGAPPQLCEPLPPDGSCGNGELDPDGSRCCSNEPDPTECMQMQWCIPGPCEPDPPQCVPADSIRCSVGSNCSFGNCEGTFNGLGIDCVCG